MTDIGFATGDGRSWIERARDNHTDAEINAYLAVPWAKARAAGYSDDEIRQHLGIKMPPARDSGALLAQANPLPPVSDEAKAEIREAVDKKLEEIGKTTSLVGKVAGRVEGFDLPGLGLEAVGRILESPQTRAPITGGVSGNIARSLQDEIDRANNAMGQQQFINGGGMPRGQ
jgi:hypothetical protein